MKRRGKWKKRLVLAAVLGAVVAIVRRQQERPASSPRGRAGAPTGPVSVQSRAERTATMAKIGGKASANYALHRARRRFASAERQIELDEAYELQTAEQVAEALGNMKGALMKLGQMASYLDAGLAEPVREALASLQQDAPPMSSELAAQVVERELGARPEEVFLEWDPKPLASASIGQVHKAITRNGRAVAVKVQYPGVDAAIKADLDNAGVIFGAMGLVFSGLESGSLVEEIRARVIEELDYELEARNQQRFADWYRGHPFIHIPDVVPELSTGRVLVTELAEGVRFDEMATWSQDERNLAAESIYRFVFRSLYRLHAFNGDPHPGNYLFRPGGQVTFLDFGLVKHFTADEIDVFGRMIDAMVVEPDLPEYRRLIEAIGLLKPGMPFTDDEVKDYFGHFYDFVRDDEEVTITPEWSQQTVTRFFDTSGPYAPIMKAANLPPSFVIIQRINLGLMAILGDLRATANFRRIAEELWPWIDGPPATELGKAEAAWLESRPDGAAGPNTAGAEAEA
jgi:predicted unusual protein kinase regulating ubiquinone biosynthesis (AarF/ABC1/UbiB family)